jgi:hypothetical protein
MRSYGFRLRTILVAIACLGVLMGLGATMRPGPMRGLYGIIVPPSQFGSARLRLDFHRWEVWIRDDSDSSSVEWLSEQDRLDSIGKISFVCIPIEYLLAIVVFVASPFVLVVDYLLRRRKWAKPSPGASLPDPSFDDLRQTRGGKSQQ